MRGNSRDAPRMFVSKIQRCKGLKSTCARRERILMA